MKVPRKGFIILMALLLNIVAACGGSDATSIEGSEYQPFDKPNNYQVIRNKDRDGNGLY